VDQERDALVEATIDRYEKYINPAMAKLLRFMGLGTIEWEARGAVITDIYGKKYLDCLGGYGVFNVGHAHPKVIEAVEKQLQKMPLSSKILFSESQGKLAEKLAQITPGDLKYTFFCNSGTEAVEGALKLARLQSGKSEIISTKNSFHGKTLGALSATGRDIFTEPCQPLLPGFKHVPFGEIEALTEAVSENTAAIILEPIQGEGGIIIPSDDYLPQVRKLCDEKGILLILDEVQTGFGRTGEMFASLHYHIVPDIMTMAKALGGGVMPIGAFIARPQIWETFITSPFIHTSTFGGNSLACSAALAAIEVVEEEKLAERARELGKYFLHHLTVLQSRYPELIFQVRGKGLLIGLELADEGIGGMLMAELINRGVMVAYTLNNPRVIRIEPPLVITREQIDQGLTALDESLEQVKILLEDDE